MTTMPVHFGIDVLIPRIMQIGLERSPYEACGIVVPDLNKPADDWVVELQNRSEDPLNSYKIDVKTIVELIEDPECWSDVLVWHTHPSGHVGPSKRDWEQRVKGLRYLVVALPRGEAAMF